MQHPHISQVSKWHLRNHRCNQKEVSKAVGSTSPSYSSGLGRLLRVMPMILAFNLIFLLPYTAQGQVIPKNSQTVESSGDIILFALPTTALASTILLKDYQGTWQFTKGFLLNQAVTLGLKYAINKDRPFKSGHYAFPSGHTSITFQAASFIHLRYGLGYGIPAYMLAGWTAYSRINATRHDGYDVLAGIVVGIGSSLLFTSPWKEKDINLSVQSDPHQWTVKMTYRF